jgi:large subunit ribosomal protein L3
MPKRTRPRRGSLQYWPRRRAKSIVARTDYWPASKEAKPLGFAGWKAGMTHIHIIDNNNKSPTFGKTVFKAVTILDAPSLFVCALRFYKNSVSAGEKWAKLPKDIILNTKMNSSSSEPKDFDDVRLVVATQPSKSGMKKTKSDLFEIGLGGNTKQKHEYGESVLGKEIGAKDIFKPGDFVDVSGVTRGFGFTGPVKRWGIRIQTRKDKQMHRHVGSIGSTVPRHIDYRVPAAGQYGFFTRTETGKRIIMIDEDTTKVTPDGGFVGYGLVKEGYILVEGSIPGPRKRLIRIRKTIRASKHVPADVKFISTQSKQGK